MWNGDDSRLAEPLGRSTGVALGHGAGRDEKGSCGDHGAGELGEGLAEHLGWLTIERGIDGLDGVLDHLHVCEVC